MVRTHKQKSIKKRVAKIENAWLARRPREAHAKTRGIRLSNPSNVQENSTKKRTHLLA